LPSNAIFVSTLTVDDNRDRDSADLTRVLRVDPSATVRIKHCLGQLTDEQIWWRSHPSLNSIGNLILHLCGNVRQWIVAGLGSAADSRNRSAEFSERGPISKG
jgi:Protein of unknown function (DUF1572)